MAEGMDGTNKIELGAVTLDADAQGISLQVRIDEHMLEARLDARDAATLERFLAKRRQGDARSGFRVPLYALLNSLSSDIKVTLVYQGTIYDVHPIDLSLTGMLIRVSQLPVAPGTRLLLRILLHDDLARLEAEVVRVDEDVIALHFLESLKHGQLTPPPALEKILSRLERLYLQNRRNGV